MRSAKRAPPGTQPCAQARRIRRPPATGKTVCSIGQVVVPSKSREILAKSIHSERTTFSMSFIWIPPFLWNSGTKSCRAARSAHTGPDQGARGRSQKHQSAIGSPPPFLARWSDRDGGSRTAKDQIFRQFQREKFKRWGRQHSMSEAASPSHGPRGSLPSTPAVPSSLLKRAYRSVKRVVR